MDDLSAVLKRWTPWVPPRQDQALQQGGLLVFDGRSCVYAHYDAATGAHADLAVVLGVSQDMAARTIAAVSPTTSATDCGCPPGEQQQ